jgi:hypothetical protein
MPMDYPFRRYRPQPPCYLFGSLRHPGDMVPVLFWQYQCDPHLQVRYDSADHRHGFRLVLIIASGPQPFFTTS